MEYRDLQDEDGGLHCIEDEECLALNDTAYRLPGPQAGSSADHVALAHLPPSAIEVFGTADQSSSATLIASLSHELHQKLVRCKSGILKP